MDYSLDEFTVEFSITPFHPLETMWYIKHLSGLYLGSNKGVIELYTEPYFFMTKELAISFLNHVINKTYSYNG
jgi:hypothetical protein